MELRTRARRIRGAGIVAVTLGVVRRSLLVTPRSERGEVRVLVSMDVEGGRYFGVFSIPIHVER